MSARLEAALAELAAAIRDEIAAAAPASAPDRLYDLTTAAGLLGIGRTALYSELQAGRVRSLKVGRRRLVPSSALAERIGSACPEPHKEAAGVRAPTATADARIVAAVPSPGDTADGHPNRRTAATPLRLPPAPPAA